MTRGTSSFTSPVLGELPSPPPRQLQSSRMRIVLRVLGVAFAAFAVWLAVRFVNRRKQPSKRFWTITALIAAPIAYPLSFGPAIAALNHGWIPQSEFGRFDRFYSPLKFFVNECRPLSTPYAWYLWLWLDDLPAG